MTARWRRPTRWSAICSMSCETSAFTRESLIVFLSDHGEGLGDHGEAEHGLFLYRSTLQVPLILKLPRGERAGETIEYPVQLIDVNPTLVSALGLQLGEHVRGTPLLAQPRPEPRDNPIYAETFFPASTSAGAISPPSSSGDTTSSTRPSRSSTTSSRIPTRWTI